MPESTIRFDGQVAIVTGAGRGLGAAYARLLAARGATVIVHDAGVAPDGTGADPSVADAVAREIVARGGAAVASYENLESADGCRRVVGMAADRHSRLDILVHNAGIVVFAALEEVDQARWDRMVRLGVDASFHLAQGALPLMKRRGYGRIVLTTSGRAMRLDAAAAGLVPYCIGKAAQVGLMVALAAELGEHDIHVNAVSPVAATRMLRRSAPELAPELVAPVVAFLASSRCRFSGLVARAEGGRFSTAEWRLADGVDLGRDPVSPETIATRWSEIAGAARG
jgi:NAD(P)-dependent dehydrogenase (short-subunit alcohol dehydrogenase family)